MQPDGLRKMLIAMLCMPALSLAATLNGRVVLAGTAPAAKKIDVTIDQYLCGNQKEAQDLILSARNEVAKAWVAEAALQQPINCATAEGDIRVLRGEKTNAAQEAAAGATAIAPAGIVMGLVTGTENTKLQVATGEYNQMIDRKISDIRRTCGM